MFLSWKCLAVLYLNKLVSDFIDFFSAFAKFIDRMSWISIRNVECYAHNAVRYFAFQSCFTLSSLIFYIREMSYRSRNLSSCIISQDRGVIKISFFSYCKVYYSHIRVSECYMTRWIMTFMDHSLNIGETVRNYIFIKIKTNTILKKDVWISPYINWQPTCFSSKDILYLQVQCLQVHLNIFAGTMVYLFQIIFLSDLIWNLWYIKCSCMSRV